MSDLHWTIGTRGNLICGDYVLTRQNNAFNDKTSYWISKKGMTISFYCFSFYDENDYWENVSDPKQWIDYFDQRVGMFLNGGAK